MNRPTDIAKIIELQLEQFTASMLAAQTSKLDRAGLQRSKLRQTIGENTNLISVNLTVGQVEYKYSLADYYIYPDLGVRGVETSQPGTASSPFKYKNMNVSREMLNSISEWITSSGHVNIYGKDKASATGLKRQVLKLGKAQRNATRNQLKMKAVWAVAKGVKKHGIKRTGFVADTMTPKAFQALADSIAKETGQAVMISITDSFNKA